MSRKTVEREVRRQFVIDAARHLFASKGIEETSMDDIAAAADYTRRTLYAYFKSRDEICLLVLVEDLKARWSRQKEALAKADTGLGKIIAWGESFYEIARENPHSLRLQFYWDFKGVSRKRIRKKVFAAFEKINNDLADGLRDIFRLGVKDGSLRPDLKIDLCISQFIYTLRAVLNRATSPTYSFARFDPDNYVKHYLDLFRRAIQNSGGTQYES
jgi:AcrR family transcriptional regulator